MFNFCTCANINEYPDAKNTFEYQNNERISEWSEYLLQPYICKKYNTYKNTMKSASSFSQIFANTQTHRQTHNMITIPLRLRFAAKIIISYLYESWYNPNNIYVYIQVIIRYSISEYMYFNSSSVVLPIPIFFYCVCKQGVEH